MAEAQVVATREHIERCSIHKWYPLLERVSIPTSLLELRGGFLEYLTQESVFIPAISGDPSFNPNRTDDFPFDPNFEVLLRNELQKYPEGVFVKLNWSAPIDASFRSVHNRLGNLRFKVPSSLSNSLSRDTSRYLLGIKNVRVRFPRHQEAI